MQDYEKWKKWCGYGILICFGIQMIIPFLWMVSSSLKIEEKIFEFPPTFIPHPVAWGNYLEIFRAMPYGKFFLNSIKIALLAVSAALFSCSLTAYAFARFEFPGKKMLFILLLSTLMVPAQVTTIPVFIIFKKAGLYNTHYPLWAPLLLGTGFGIFLLRQFFVRIPKELEEAARIDGCSPWGIYWRIFLPLSLPALTTLGIFTFMGSWNDLWTPLIYLESTDLFTLPAGLSFLQSGYASKWHLLMVGANLSVIPMLVIYFFLQDFFIEGISGSGIKG